jgi:hypothetical protein
MGVFGVSALFMTGDPLLYEGQVLVATFAAGMAILGLAVILTGFRRGQWWAWLALWYYPVFFAIHVLALGLVVPDGIFAVLAVAALLLGRPSRPVQVARGVSAAG